MSNYCKECYKKQEQIEQLQAENEHYRKEAYRLADGLNKTENLAFTYKQALQEIRVKCQMSDVFGAEDIRQIIDKINSVIGAE